MSSSIPDPTALQAQSNDAADTSMNVTTTVSTDTANSSTRAPPPAAATTTMALSPARSQQGTSVPNSPAPDTAADRSPAMTPTQPPAPSSWQQTQSQTQQPNHGVVLGLEQLERQQDEAERRKREQAAMNKTATTPLRPQPTPVLQQQQQQRYVIEDDDHTAPSSTQPYSLGGTDGSTSLGSGDDHISQSGNNRNNAKSVSTKFEKMIQKTRRRLSSNEFFLMRRRNSGEMEDPAEDDEEEPIDALIYGHLQKLGRNGKWQTRWFETDGECLSYYKTSKRTKLLATLDLEKVGSIVINEDDPKGCTFTIQVLGRPYYLRAESRAACKDWVITLNRVKEARLQQGNVKLANLHSSRFRRNNPPDLLDRNVSTYTPGVVAVANRQRTRAMDEATIENMEELHKADPSHPQYNPAAAAPFAYDQGEDDLGGSLSDIVLARWQKRKSSMSRLASKLARWAKSLNKYKCNDMGHHDDDVRLDRHLHPPGHDDPRKRPIGKKMVQRRTPQGVAAPGTAGWIGKDGSLGVNPGPEADQGMDLPPAVVTEPVAARAAIPATARNDDEDEEETRELS